MKEVFEILEKSSETFEPFDESYEDKQEKALKEKYKEAIKRRGPFFRGLVGTMDGFDFRVYSGDHEPKHFHVIHKGRGIDARFSFPDIELISYKGLSSTIGSKESKKIRELFKIPENFKRLSSEFQRQIQL